MTKPVDPRPPRDRVHDRDSVASAVRGTVRVAALGVAMLATACGSATVTNEGPPPPHPRPTAPGLYGGDAPPDVIGAGSPGQLPSGMLSTARPAMTLAPTSPPVASSGPTEPPDPGEPADVVARMQPSFKVCFDQALEADPKAGGTVRFDVVLLPTGEVKSVSIKENVGLSAVVVSCAMAVLQKAKFRPPAGGTITHVEIPIQFRPRT